MPKQKNLDTVAELKDKLSRSKLTVFTDYRGLSTVDLNTLRDELLKVESEYTITKNTLLSLALQQSDLRDQTSDIRDPKSGILEGPTATLFAYADESSPVKAVLKLVKTLSLPVIKGGILGEQSIDASQVEALGRLPSREVLVGKVVGGFASPLYGIVNVLQGNIRNLVYTLNAVAQKKQ